MESQDPMRAFSDSWLAEVLTARRGSTLRKIAQLDADYVLKASTAELEQHFVDEVYISPLAFRTSELHIADRRGADIDVSHEFDRAVFPGERAVVRGTRLRLDIPFDGDPSLWKCRPSSYSVSGYPDVAVADGRVSLSIEFPDDSADSKTIKARIDRDVESLARAVNTVNSDVASFNAQTPELIRAALAKRLSRAKETADAVAALGIPLKRAGTPPAYAAPVVRRKVHPSLPRVQTDPYAPEPFLEAAEYDNILRILQSMALVIERNPQSFTTLDEEAIRNHFLLQLNGHYEGSATGETFNASGKTDILIRVKDRNIFIAECKFWKGAKGFDEAISQLLGYLSWRDSKCALLVFNATKDSSAIAAKMHESMTARTECKKAVGKPPHGDQRYMFVKPSDPGREITITTVLFDVPRP